MSKPEFIITGQDGESISLPCHFEVCDRCNSTGVHDNPAFSNGIAQDQFDEDPDFREAYFRGDYDTKCMTCNGNRVISVPDEERCTPEQREALETHRRCQSEDAAERRMRERGIEF